MIVWKIFQQSIQQRIDKDRTALRPTHPGYFRNDLMNSKPSAK